MCEQPLLGQRLLESRRYSPASSVHKPNSPIAPELVDSGARLRSESASLPLPNVRTWPVSCAGYLGEHTQSLRLLAQSHSLMDIAVAMVTTTETAGEGNTGGTPDAANWLTLTVGKASTVRLFVLGGITTLCLQGCSAVPKDNVDTAPRPSDSAAVETETTELPPEQLRATFASIQFTFVGAAGNCAVDDTAGSLPPCKDDAWFRVESDRKFINKDERGQHDVLLTQQEFDEVLTWVATPTFVSTLTASDCPAAFDVAVSVTVERKDGAVQTDTRAAGCFGYRSNPHPYTQLQWLFIDYMQKYDKCPVLDPDQLPEVVPRLCSGCWAYDPPSCSE